MPSSRIVGFYRLDVAERIKHLSAWLEDDPKRLAEILHGTEGLSLSTAEHMIENVVGVFGLPFGIATNFLINGRDYLIPMAVEEPSIVAACSNSAKVVRLGGGFTTYSDSPIMIGQIQVLEIPDIQQALAKIEQERERLIALANDPTSSIVKRGGGVRHLEARVLEDTRIGRMLVLHLHYDVRDAMGANAINTACEALAPEIEALTGGRVNLRILSNYSDQRKATAQCLVPAEALATETADGQTVVQRIIEAAIFAEIDVYRAVTHNKGIMNGIDAVLIATGNDWRAVEAGAHAYAARDGQYRSMTRWWQDEDGNLRGELTLPLAVGIVGGATKVHPLAQLALRLLNVESAQQLSEIIVAVGLAQNLGAIRALATDGIQRGHMALHARQLAIAAGASPEHVSQIAEQMIREGNIRLERAKTLVQDQKITKEEES